MSTPLARHHATRANIPFLRVTSIAKPASLCQNGTLFSRRRGYVLIFAGITMRYHRFSILLHWLMVAMILLLFMGGLYMTELPADTPYRSWFFAQHKSLGLTTGLLAFIRLAWRFPVPPPPLPPTFSRWQVSLTHSGHSLLYLFMFLQPLSGYLSSTFSGYSTKWWGIPLPHWGWKATALNETFTALHETFSICLLVLVAGHVGAVILHHWQGDKLLYRMWPRGAEQPYQHPMTRDGGA